MLHPESARLILIKLFANFNWKKLAVAKPYVIYTLTRFYIANIVNSLFLIEIFGSTVQKKQDPLLGHEGLF